MKQDTITINKKLAFEPKTGVEKRAVILIVAVILLAYAFCICSMLLWENSLTRVGQPLLFIMAGILHVYLIREKVQLASFIKEWIYTLAATALLILLLGSSARWIPLLSLPLVFSCGSAFLLPFIVAEMWRTKLQIAYEDVRIWYPTDESLTDYFGYYFNGSSMRFRIIQGNGKATVSIKFRVSNAMSLGKIFYDLTQNKTVKTRKFVALTDAVHKPYHWVFFTPDWLVLNRTLDPEKTLRENGLKENAVIYAQKVFQKDMTMLKNQIH